MIIYVAGKITGDSDFVNKFNNAELNLKIEGHTVLNPAKLPAVLEYEQYMNMCFSMIAEADCIYLLKDYRDSPGALRELEYAKKLGKKVRTEVNDTWKEALDIEDSGNRREFETGAVRDIQEGKGRYDLLPWDAIHELAIHCEQGALKYGERNCEKGIPINSLIDSAFRHLSSYQRGMDDEPHLRAAAWNIMFAIWTEKNIKE